ncbi:MAG: hypothetical protein ACREYC_10445 [Gammaproteobacteria bacterium]
MQASVAKRNDEGLADRPDAYRVNRYLRGIGTGAEAVESLAASPLRRLDVAERRCPRLCRLTARATTRSPPCISSDF